jgi:hypothetical protein
MIYSDNNLLYCKNIIRHVSAPILQDLLDWGEGVAGISKLGASVKDETTDIKLTEKRQTKCQRFVKLKELQCQRTSRPKLQHI